MRIARFLAAVAANALGAVPRPAWCTYLVTMRCNARCRMCDSWRLPPGRELPAEAVYRLFAALGPLDVVRLSGGEPFLREDFPAVAEAVEAASRPLVLHVTTNGSRPEAVEAFAASFPRPRALRFLVSVDGLGAVHDANRGPEVSFALADETVRRLVRLRRRLGVQVSVNHTVISEPSRQDASRLQQHFARYGVPVGTVLAYAESATYSLSARRRPASPSHPAPGYPLHPALAGVDVLGLVAEELARLSTAPGLGYRLGKRYYLAGLLARLRGDPAPSPRPRCVALRSHLRLLPDGSVPVCQFNGTVVGNAAVSHPRQLLRSPAARAARRWVDACPGCWAECEVIPNAVYTGDILRGLRLRPPFARSSQGPHNLPG